MLDAAHIYARCCLKFAHNLLKFMLDAAHLVGGFRGGILYGGLFINLFGGVPWFSAQFFRVRTSMFWCLPVFWSDVFS